MQTKTFRELLPGDKVYYCNINSLGPKETLVESINKDNLFFNIESLEKIGRDDKKNKTKVITWNYHNRRTVVVFSCEITFKEYLKDGRMVILNELLENAQKEVDKVKKFRVENFDLFNGNWIDKKIESLNIF